MTDTLMKLEGATRMLAEARTLDEVLHVKDIAQAAAEYARAARLGLEAQNHAAEIKLRAERKAGELLKGLERGGGGDRKSPAAKYQNGNAADLISEYRNVLVQTDTPERAAARWQQIAKMPEPVFEEYVEKTKAAGEEITTTGALRAASAPHVTFNSGDNEWYTPVDYIVAARLVMGDIDTDPASSAIANSTVSAAVYYTAETDGLSQLWHGRVWMNPPYAQPLIGQFCQTLKAQYGRTVTEAITLTNNATDTAWFHDLLSVASAVCFIRGRVRFIDPSGSPSGAPLQGQAVCYLGSNVDRFREAFSQFGKVLHV